MQYCIYSQPPFQENGLLKYNLLLGEIVLLNMKILNMKELIYFDALKERRKLKLENTGFINMQL